jgi:hypothetical protein
MKGPRGGCFKPAIGLFALAGLIVIGSGTTSAADRAIGHVVTAQGGALIRSERPGGRPIRVAKAGDEVFVGDTVNTASSGNVKLLLVDKTIIDIGSSALFTVKKVEGGGPGRKIEVGLPYGTARAAVAQPLGAGGEFRVRSSAATMGVRGTEFVIQSPLENPSQVSGRANHESRESNSASPKTTVTVLQGLVAVESHSSSSQGVGGLSMGRSPAQGGSAPVMLPAGTQLSTVLNPTALTSGAGALGDRGPASQVPGSGASGPVRVDTQTLSSLSSSTRVVDTTFRDAITLDLSGPPAKSGGSDESGRASQSMDRGGASSSPAGGESAASSVAGNTDGTAASSTDSSAGNTMDEAGSSTPSASSAAGTLANFTASLILDTVVAPPPSIAAVSAPEAVVQSVAQASFTGGASVENTVAAAQNVAPLTAGGTRKLTVIIAP